MEAGYEFAGLEIYPDDSRGKEYDQGRRTPVHIAAVPEPKPKNLEKELGVDLFERSRQGVVLTPAGEHYVEWAKQILFAEAMMKRKIQDISAKNVRQIKFGTTPQRTSYILDFVVNQFQKEYANYKSSLRTGRRQSCTNCLTGQP